ncbi:MAG: cellulase family glycosylhydrolase [Zavarzinella sp.]
MAQRAYKVLFLLSSCICSPQFTLAEEQSPLGKKLPQELELIQVSQNQQHFVGKVSEKKFVVWGVNYDHDEQGRLLEDYWHQEWTTVVDDFAEMKELGINLVRIHLQLGKFMSSATEANQKELGQLKKLVKLAEKTRLYLDITGLACYHKAETPKWYDALNEKDRWEVQVRFWQTIAQICNKCNAIFCYNLMNEPILPGAKQEREWVTGELAGKSFVQRISLDLKGRTREEVAEAWVGKLCQSIRKIDPHHMITVGVIPWATVFPQAKPIFYAPPVAKHLDFVSIHFYPDQKKSLEESIAALKVYAINKPLVIEEIFPLKSSLEHTDAFIVASEKYCAGWVSFYWGKTPQEYSKEKNLKSQIMVKWLEYFEEKGKKLKAKE